MKKQYEIPAVKQHALRPARLLTGSTISVGYGGDNSGEDNPCASAPPRTDAWGNMW